ncbi:MAG: thioredoxin family protein [Crocinitomicaceae bacterium]|nr:thioredoxin family protein [Crocinitomicaceae bacterium]
MQLVLFALVAFTLNFNGFSQETEDEAGIQFVTGTWEEVLAIAKKAKKSIFVDAYTTWCGPCKWMSKTTFTDSNVGSFMSKNFISYKMDMEKGEGVDFAKKNNVQVYPTLLFFDPKGRLNHRAAGALNADAFLETCRNAQDPTERFGTFQRKFERGDSSKEYLLKYINKCNNAGMSSEEPFNKYWLLLEPDEKINEENLVLMNKITRGFSDMDHELFIFMKTNKSKYIKKVGEEKFNPYWSSAYKSAIWYAASEKKSSDQKAKIKKAKSIFTGKKGEIDAFYEMNLAWVSKDEKKISKTAAVYVEVTTDWVFLNSEAWKAYEDSDSEQELEKALGWTNKSIELNSNYMNLDTKGAILYKLKRYEEAIASLEKAVSKADENVRETDLSTTETLLRKIIIEMQGSDDD